MKNFSLHFNVAMLMFWVGIVIIDVRRGDPFLVHVLVCCLLIVNISIVLYVSKLRERMERFKKEVRNPCIFKA